MIPKKLAPITRRILIGALLAATACPALAQDYPARPVRMITPFTPGSPVDVVARLTAQHLGTMMFLMRSAPEGSRAAAQGDLATANTLAMAAASALAGALYGASGSLAYLAMAALAALGAGCALVAARFT